MLYSVWNHAERVYDYYQCPGKDGATSAPKPAHLRAPKLGIIPEKAAWPLPTGAVKIGRGKYPKGYIASKMSKPGLGDVKVLGASVGAIALWLLAGYGAMRAMEGRL